MQTQKSALQGVPAAALDGPTGLAGVAAHGIGRGGFAALVFSGSIEALGEVPGYCTWNTPRKFAIPDPRIPAERDLARAAAWPLPRWPPDRVRPTPGVCFVLSDEQHPVVEALRARDGIEFEHFIVLPRLTLANLVRLRIERFLVSAGKRPIALLGYGDQGARFAAAMVECGVSPARVTVFDNSPVRRAAAADVGFQADDLQDSGLGGAAVISSPLTCPSAFRAAVDSAAREGCPVLDNSLPWDDRPELVRRGSVWLTPCADRSARLEGSVLSPADHGLDLRFAAIHEEEVRFAHGEVRALRSGHRFALGGTPGSLASCELSRPRPDDPLGHLRAKHHRAFVNIEGQSNHADAAFAIFAAREFLRGLFPETVPALLPSEHRGAFGATPFEDLVPRSITGRSLATPFMTACEQTAIGVLARHYCGSGERGHPIVEIGSALGGSALLMAAATTGANPADDPPIISIDPDAPTRGAMRAAFDQSGFSPRLTQVVKTSCGARAELQHFAGRAGLVFIDGLHTADASARDFANYAPLVRSGGCLAFHDCDLRHAGVFATVAGMVVPDTRFVFRCLVDTLAVFERRA